MKRLTTMVLAVMAGAMLAVRGAVNAAGEGTTTWTPPMKAGRYYLTHETQTNGVNGAELLGALFEVEGPELTFAADGELVPGVKVAIGGVGEGWTVRYEVVSMDGGALGTTRPTRARLRCRGGTAWSGGKEVHRLGAPKWQAVKL